MICFQGDEFIEEKIQLPEYVKNLATEFTIQITPIYDGKIKMYNTSTVINNEFTVYGENGKFFWTVFGTRDSIIIEPNKIDVDVKGTGPYRWV